MECFFNRSQVTMRDSLCLLSFSLVTKFLHVPSYSLHNMLASTIIFRSVKRNRWKVVSWCRNDVSWWRTWEERISLLLTTYGKINPVNWLKFNHQFFQLTPFYTIHYHFSISKSYLCITALVPYFAQFLMFAHSKKTNFGKKKNKTGTHYWRFTFSWPFIVPTPMLNLGSLASFFLNGNFTCLRN